MNGKMDDKKSDCNSGRKNVFYRFFRVTSLAIQRKTKNVSLKRNKRRGNFEIIIVIRDLHTRNRYVKKSCFRFGFIR